MPVPRPPSLPPPTTRPSSPTAGAPALPLLARGASGAIGKAFFGGICRSEVPVVRRIVLSGSFRIGATTAVSAIRRPGAAESSGSRRDHSREPRPCSWPSGDPAQHIDRVVGHDDAAKLRRQIVRLRDDPDTGLRPLGAGHHAADVVGVDRNLGEVRLRRLRRRLRWGGLPARTRQLTTTTAPQSSTFDACVSSSCRFSYLVCSCRKSMALDQFGFTDARFAAYVCHQTNRTRERAA